MWKPAEYSHPLALQTSAQALEETCSDSVVAAEPVELQKAQQDVM